MLGASTQAVRRSVVIAAVALLVSVATGSGAAGAPVRPAQESPAEERQAEADRALVDIDPSESAEEAAATLEDLQDGVVAQLEQVERAQAAVRRAEGELADAQSAVDDIEMRVEDLQVRTDDVVAEAFVNPPIQEGVDVFASDSIEEATVRQAILDAHAADSAATLDELQEQQERLEELREVRAAALAEANEARARAEAALADLEEAVSAQTRFVLSVRNRLARGAAASDDPAVRQRAAEIQRIIDEIQAAEEYARAMEALAAAERARQAREAAERQRQLEEAQEQASSGGGASGGGWVCPVQGGGLHFADTWGAARSGGRSHQGTDMMAARGTPTVAPVSGTVEHRSNSLGGNAWYVYGDDGNTYYGAHLDSYANQGAGHVEAGTVIGYVGTSGNAPEDAPHLHFEYMPGGGESVNPYSRLVEAC